MKDDATAQFLTTRELADLLRIKERKVYELVSSGQIPVTRATGKLLFPRDAIVQWMESNSSGGFAKRRATTWVDRPLVFAGSHDPLLEWCLRESRSGLASYFDGSLDGLNRFANNRALAFALHVRDGDSRVWNTPLIKQHFPNQPVVLVEFAWRERGLLVRNEARATINNMCDLVGRWVVPRQPEAGSQVLFNQLLEDDGIPSTAVNYCNAARSETDAAIAVSEGKADAAFGLSCLARQFNLVFVPIVRERFDFLLEHRHWFEPELQQLITFCRSEVFRQKAKELGGYEVDGFGAIHLNLWPGRN